MTESERWRLALRAHAAEHRAMHERGIGRIGISGRPRGTGFLPSVPFGPRGGMPRARGMHGLGELSPAAKAGLWGLGGLAVGAALVFGADRMGWI